MSDQQNDRQDPAEPKRLDTATETEKQPAGDDKPEYRDPPSVEVTPGDQSVQVEVSESDPDQN